MRWRGEGQRGEVRWRSEGPEEGEVEKSVRQGNAAVEQMLKGRMIEVESSVSEGSREGETEGGKRKKAWEGRTDGWTDGRTEGEME